MPVTLEKQLVALEKQTREIEVVILTCSRCGHRWAPRLNYLPKRCPKCSNSRWNTPKKLSKGREKKEGGIK